MGEKKAPDPAYRVTRGCNYPDPAAKRGERREVRLEPGDPVPADIPPRVLRALQRRGAVEEA